jgi:hypothetical protein
VGGIGWKQKTRRWACGHRRVKGIGELVYSTSASRSNAMTVETIYAQVNSKVEKRSVFYRKEGTAGYPKDTGSGEN